MKIQGKGSTGLKLAQTSESSQEGRPTLWS